MPFNGAFYSLKPYTRCEQPVVLYGEVCNSYRNGF